MFTSEGSGARKQPSALLEWCKQNHAQLLAVQYPGRHARKAEQFLGSAQDMAAAILPVLSPALNKPYVVLAHSVGCWVSFELLHLIRSAGLPMPRGVIYSAFPSPDIPVDQRPWRVGRELDEPGFKDEAREWDVNEEVFSDMLWAPSGWNFHAILRADFSLFDCYEYDPAKGEQLFDFPLQTFYATCDKKVTKEMVAGWNKFTTGSFECEPIEGHHLFPLVKEGKAEWLGMVARVLARFALPVGAAGEELGDNNQDQDLAEGSDDDLEYFM
eukprot:TRINITY_DN50152_c0_g1_i2.p1 TRINITY_DN50152_c0_g1~~TRINITY_DN50152_c0_g1_i2.p1  ORF type:complete len:271 (-),score=40.75 TRINITY_DN50152_c0_g1_i2:137-949(-)